jgi:DNA-binding NarL/FixJ family response regulator
MVLIPNSGKQPMPTTEPYAISKPIVVSVVYKDPLVRAGVATTLSAEPNFDVHVASEPSASNAWSALLCEVIAVDVVVADYERALALDDLLKSNSLMRAVRAPKIMIVSERGGEWEIRHALERGIQGYLLLGCRLDEMAGGVMALHRGHRYLGQEPARRIAESFSYEALTSREGDVLRLVAAGYANKAVAKRLDIALGTVKVHVKSILGKLGARTRTEAAAVAQRRGLLHQDGDPLPGARAALYTRRDQAGSLASIA